MLESFIIDRVVNLAPLLNRMEHKKVLLLVMFSLERQWKLFQIESEKNKDYNLLGESVRNCMDLLWDEYFDSSRMHVSSRIKNYEKNTDNFELVEMGQDLIYSRVLVETLFGVSFLFSSDSYPLYGEECAYAIFSTLEVIFNYKIDSIPRKPENEMLEILKNEAHILAELKRIDYDITIANSLDTDKNIIITLQKEYRTLNILN